VTISGANAGGAQTAISGISAGTAVMTSGTAIFWFFVLMIVISYLFLRLG